MSDDLVKRLRKVEPDAPGERTRWYRNPDGPEAANRIEELEAALRKLTDAIGERETAADDLIAGMRVAIAWHDARAALGEKQA